MKDMMLTFNVSDLKKVILKESANEFKAVVFGDEETKKINDKAYSDIKKETSDYDGGLTSEKKTDVSQSFKDGKGMGDLEFDNISKPYKDRIKSQMKGYVSADAEKKHKNDDFGNADFDKEGKIYDAEKEHAEASKEGRDKASEIGLTGREVSKDKIKANSDTMYESKNKMKMLSFKKIEFLSEGHMLSKVPDEYKKEGNKFIMRDGRDNQYLVEWTSGEPTVSKKVNMNIVNEEKQRIKELWGYKPAEANTNTTPRSRIQEDNSYAKMLERARELMHS